MKRLLFLIAVLIGFSQPLRAAPYCCTVTAIDVRTGTATAIETATGRTFEFHVPNPRLFATVRVGTPVYANFSTKQVSLDGKTPCGEITQINPAPPRGGVAKVAPPASAAPSAAPPGPAPAPGASAPARPAPGAPAAAAPPASGTHTQTPIAAIQQERQGSTHIPSPLPSATAGTPQVVQYPNPQDLTARPVSPFGHRPNQNVVHLRGADGIQQATNLPAGAKNLLLLHAYTLGPGEVDHYIVNTQLAKEWINAHPALANVQPPSSHDSHAGCKVTITNPCLKEDVQHIASEATRQSEAFLKASRDEWKHVTHELAHDLQMAEGCFADQTLHLKDVPVKFTDFTPELTLHFNKDGKADLSGTTSNQHGSASGQVTGVIKLGLPMDADFTAQVDMFWIECIPFVIRPKSIKADGAFAVGTKITAELVATGQFSQEFTVPPTGGPHFPIEIIPIVIAGVPIAELDVSVYIDGKLYVDGNGKLDAKFSLESRRATNAFDFLCSGSGCEITSHGLPSKPATASESVKLEGRIHVKPAVYVALQLDFDVNALTARAGPQPYLFADVYACGAASATQTMGGPTTTQQSYAVTADLDWGIDLRAEALVGVKQVAQVIKRIFPRPGSPPEHLAFWDLAHSTALLPHVEGATQASVGTAALYKIKMPACYPYPDHVKYKVTWTGNATASTSNPGIAAASGLHQQAVASKPGRNGAPSTSNSTASPCNLQPGQGDCQGDPLQDFVLNLVWPAAGTYNLTVAADGDTPHHREYNPPGATTLNITVQP
jgi:hypothetical protein